MQNPTVQRALTNPRVMQAINQIQSGIQQLQQEAPDMLPLLGMTPSPMFSSFASQSSPAGASTSTPQSSTTTASQGGTTTTPPSTTGSQTGTNPLLSQMFQSMLQQQVGQSRSQQPPEERFRTQLEQLASMGFVDRAANLQGLLLIFTSHEFSKLAIPLKLE